MAFIQPCFIKKNTPELRAKLEKIGYKKDECFEGNLPFIYIGDYSDCGLGPLYSEANYGAPILFNTNFKRIDCKTNEKLFLAIAALRDDTDVNQWFIYNTINNTVGKFETIEWVLCKDNNICDYLNWDNCYKYCHKATVEEIIEHFKKQ